MTSTQNPMDAHLAVRLAKQYADVRGYEGRPGGWIYNPAGNAVAHGWAAFALELRRTGHLRRIAGTNRLAINWMADHR